MSRSLCLSISFIYLLVLLDLISLPLAHCLFVSISILSHLLKYLYDDHKSQPIKPNISGLRGNFAQNDAAFQEQEVAPALIFYQISNPRNQSAKNPPEDGLLSTFLPGS